MLHLVLKNLQSRLLLGKNLIQAFVIITIFSLTLFSATAQIIVTKKPVKPKTVIVKSAKPGPNYVWIDGHWKVHKNKYVWVKGHWIEAKAGHKWVSGHWTKVKGGWKWVPGHWKVVSSESTDAEIIVVKKPLKPKSGIVRPAKPGPNYIWIDGHWKAHKGNYVWVTGHWIKAKAGHKWVPGQWTRVKGGWKWIPGNWKAIHKDKARRIKKRR